MKTRSFFLYFVVITIFILACESTDDIEDVYDVSQNVPSTFEMKPYLILDNWEYMQGGDIYKDYLICLGATDQRGTPNGFIYDLLSGRKLQTLSFGSSIGKKKYYQPHANQVSFGCSLFNKESDFPLLYVSQVNGGNGTNDIRGERGVLVYNLEKNEIGQYEPRLVQTIIPNMLDVALMKKLGDYTPNYIVDTDKNQFVIIGYPNNSWYNLDGPQPVSILPIPSTSEGTEIVFSNDDLTDFYTLSSSVAPQQSFYYQGKIFSSCGVYEQASLRVIDLEKKMIVWNRDLTDMTKGEPQFLGLWNHKVLYYENGTSGQMYEITIPGFQF